MRSLWCREFYSRHVLSSVWSIYIYVCMYEILNFRIKTPHFFYEVTFLQQKVSQILRIPNNNFKPDLVYKISRIKVYNALALPIFYVEMKF